MIRLIESSPWQVGVVLLAIWLSLLSTALVFLVRYIHARAEEFPAKTMQGLLESWRVHRDSWAPVDPVVVAEHIRRAGERTLTCAYHERAIGRLETNVGEVVTVVNRLGILEAKVEEQSKNIARHGQKNEAEHGELMKEVVKVGKAVARLQGHRNGPAPGPPV